MHFKFKLNIDLTLIGFSLLLKNILLFILGFEKIGQKSSLIKKSLDRLSAHPLALKLFEAGLTARCQHTSEATADACQAATRTTIARHRCVNFLAYFGHFKSVKRNASWVSKQLIITQHIARKIPSCF